MKKLDLSRIFNSNACFALLTLFIPVCIILAAHGAQKLFGWFVG